MIRKNQQKRPGRKNPCLCFIIISFVLLNRNTNYSHQCFFKILMELYNQMLYHFMPSNVHLSGLVDVQCTSTPLSSFISLFSLALSPITHDIITLWIFVSNLIRLNKDNLTHLHSATDIFIISLRM